VFNLLIVGEWPKERSIKDYCSYYNFSMNSQHKKINCNVKNIKGKEKIQNIRYKTKTSTVLSLNKGSSEGIFISQRVSSPKKPA